MSVKRASLPSEACSGDEAASSASGETQTDYSSIYRLEKTFSSTKSNTYFTVCVHNAVKKSEQKNRA